MTLTNLTTLKKKFEKSWSFIRRAHFQCRIFAPSFKTTEIFDFLLQQFQVASN